VTILDTNVISALMSDPAELRLVAWLDRQAQSSIWTTSITLFEIRTVLLLMAAGRKQSKLSEALETFLEGIEHRVAIFDEEAAAMAAELSASRRKAGRPGELRDTMIAGIVLARHATVATRNVSQFSDISANVVDPWAP
jgi:toxin FitB